MKNAQTVPRLATALLLAILTASCAAKPPRLLYHLAVAEVDEQTSRRRRYSYIEEIDARTTACKAFDLEFELGAVTSALVESFSDGSFAHVSRINFGPGGNRTDVRSMSPELQLKYWAKMARDKHADLLLIPRIEFDPRIRSFVNQQFWFMFPIYPLPLSWAVRDRSYFFDVKLEGTLVDVSRETPRVLGTPLVREYEVQTNLFERCTKELGFYVLAVIIPSAFLRWESPSQAERVRTRLVNQLARKFRREVERESDRLLSNEGLWLEEVAADSSNPERLTGHYILEGGSKQLVDLRDVLITVERENPQKGGDDLRVTTPWPLREIVNDADPDQRIFHFEVDLDPQDSEKLIQLRVLTTGREGTVANTIRLPKLEFGTD